MRARPLPLAFSALAGLAVLTMNALAVSAEEPCASTLRASAKDGAMKEFRSGRDALARGDFSAALAGFDQAYCAFPAPAFLRAVSEAEFRLGRCADARATARRWKEAASRLERPAVEEWLTRLAAECVRVSVEVSPPAASLTLDGVAEPLAAGRWSSEIPIGQHHLIASCQGYSPREQDLVVTADVSPQVSLELHPSEPIIIPLGRPAETRLEPSPPTVQPAPPPQEAAAVPAPLPPVKPNVTNAPPPAPPAPPMERTVNLLPPPPAMPPSALVAEPPPPPGPRPLTVVGYIGLAVGGAGAITAAGVGFDTHVLRLGSQTEIETVRSQPYIAPVGATLAVSGVVAITGAVLVIIDALSHPTAATERSTGAAR